ncbi:MAG: hypothetical protein WCO94_00660 [Verrucomicrobiota bacterium]
MVWLPLLLEITRSLMAREKKASTKAVSNTTKARTMIRAAADEERPGRKA